MGYALGMTTTQTVTINGHRIGLITLKSINTNGQANYMASRIISETGVDARRVSYGFRTIEAATAWIARVA